MIDSARRLIGAPWHAAVAAAFPVLFLFVHNYEETPFRDLVLPLVIAMVGAALVFAVFLALSRSASVAAVITAAACAVFYGYGPATTTLTQLGVAVRHRWALLTAALLFSLAVYWAWRHPRQCRALSRPLNTFTAVLVALTAIRLLSKVVRQDPSELTAASAAVERAWVDRGVAISADRAPSIYYIVLDGYARNDVLRSLYGFDNDPFTDFLASRGFMVNPRSRANYYLTFPSLASSLNGILLPDVLREGGSRSVLYDMVRRNAVADFLRKRGYRIVNISSGWGPTAFLAGADVNVGCGAPSEFSDILLRSTIAWRVLASPYGRGAFSAYSSRLCSLESLKEVAASPGPKFVLAHILLPHPPFLFGPEGERLTDRSALGDQVGWISRPSYIGQVTFVNATMKQVLDTVISRDPSNPVIILQSDHGPASSPGWERPQGSPELIRERMPILSAVRLPGHERVTEEGFITPVNTFGTLFALYFGAEATPRPNVSYFRHMRVDSLLRD